MLLLTASLAMAQGHGEEGAAVPAGRSEISIAPFRENIAMIERQHGAMDYRLSELFLGLGLAYRANGDSDSAIAALRQALHVNRVNKGLHDLVHIPIVDLLIDAYAERRDWEEVERQQRYRYWIHRRELESNSDDFVDAAIAFAAWETRAYALETELAAYRHLRDAQDALQKALQALAANGPPDDPRRMQILNSLAVSYLNLAHYLSDTEVDPVTGGAVAGQDFGDIIARRNLIIECFIRGGNALDQVVELTATYSPGVEHGLALANRADWELLFDRPQSSHETYREAYAQLRSAGLSEEEIALEFGQPRVLSTFSLRRRRQPDGTDEATSKVPFVVASFEVTTTGAARKVEVLEAYPSDHTGIVRRARADLRTKRFRPRIGSDGPVQAASTIRYVFPDISI